MLRRQVDRALARPGRGVHLGVAPELDPLWDRYNVHFCVRARSPCAQSLAGVHNSLILLSFACSIRRHYARWNGNANQKVQKEKGFRAVYRPDHKDTWESNPGPFRLGVDHPTHPTEPTLRYTSSTFILSLSAANPAAGLMLLGRSSILKGPMTCHQDVSVISRDTPF